MKIMSTISYILSAIFISMGFYKMFVYENNEYTFMENEYVNAYVGSDAANLTINAGYATAYFVLATLFVILGSSIIIISKLSSNQTKQLTSQSEAPKQEGFFENIQTHKLEK